MTSREDNIRAWQQRYVNDGKYAGSALLIKRHGEEIFFHAAGLRNVEEQLPFTRDTVVRMYSMTKPITSVVLLMLLERGLFHLEAPVSDFLPGFSDMRALIDGASSIDQTVECRSPTLHELLTHTSGLSYPFNPGVLAEEMAKTDLMFKSDQASLQAQVAELAKLPLAFHPGTRWEYSVATDVLGAVIEVVTGRELADVFREFVFEPLKMSETGFAVQDGTGNRFASLYTPLAGDAMALNAATPDENQLRLVEDYHNSIYRGSTMRSGGGGLLGTLDDFMAFAEMFRCDGRCADGAILSPSISRFMRRNHLPGDIASMGPQSFAEQPMDGMGFGLGGAVVLDPARARCPGSVGDFSWGGMASTFFWIDPVLDLSVVFLTQLAPSSSYPSRAELKALVHGMIDS
ncbi:serine hydrolase [Phaeobacter sp.]|uniref:serine hydrolase domain-containing protein n=1 Tax=Phaeobacter sp. TaxID=1902409 RepID=UPI0025EDEB04|nr:serine hydrolase domain-containing protein [Phaeobacter sp.]